MEFSGIEKLSLVDFDGHIACTLFTKGCNFRCPFCHNSFLVLPEISVEPLPFEEIITYLKKRTGVLDGVVITGGEPTLMPDLVDKLTAIKELGYDIKLDTNGTHPEVIEKLIKLELVDYIAMDIKSSLKEYPKIVDSFVNLETIKKSIELIMNSGIDYEFRTTIIDEFHNNEVIKDIAQLISGAKKYRLQLYIDTDNCISHGFHEVSLEKANVFIEILKSHIDDVALRGYKLEF